MPMPAVPAADGEPSTQTGTTFSDALAVQEMPPPHEQVEEQTDEMPPAPFALPMFVWRPPLEVIEVPEYAAPVPKQASLAAPAIEAAPPAIAEVAFSGTIELRTSPDVPVPAEP